MEDLSFAWDERKNWANRRKHGVTFEEAVSAFYDPDAAALYDDEHSEWEDRFLLIGTSSRRRILLVCHCLREEESVIRIISARRATAKERAFYRSIKP
ncbi:MAG: BrnT family toxin [Planctomycetes bacterium]|nr:BrnT family toxin [Planctomycetota bacterium]